ncbi:carbohydrate ABC transporter permease [Pseudovibrio exalbescens]|uniref:sn-glycerol-3-phosphate transport system permease protein UgpA n=1 Tax=Pseudovibrio exalbescens TaxID=197461 RepID=A0A1U7JK40_9HYPH|nr:sugar ABC transporter permease [Pseudovibrio exalbescens]OKL45089.1 glycerol-3-phosphate transporter permease [Pseudovibrio exalbescens]
MSNRFYRNKWLPLWLASPQLVVLFFFFYLPVFLAFFWSFHLERPFGGGSQFVGWQNFERVLSDPEFWTSLWRTLTYMVVASSTSIICALVLALAADRGIRMSPLARNVLIWPKAVAAASIGVIFLFIFNPFMGILAPLNEMFPGFWNPRINPVHTWIMIYIANIWSAIPFTFIILLTGLQSIPDTLHKAAAIDGAGPWRRLFDIQLPLLTPQLFIVVVLEIADSLSGSFALIDTMSQGGPGGATNLLVYKIYVDGFKAYDLSGAATQTAMLMIVVAAVTAFQYLVVEKRVKYER